MPRRRRHGMPGGFPAVSSGGDEEEGGGRRGTGRRRLWFPPESPLGTTRGDTGSRTGSFFQYQRLECRDDGAALQPRRRWLLALNGKAACSCFFPLKKLKWSRITSALLPWKVAEFSSKIRQASVTDADEVCRTIIFLSQRGLPVLSRPSLAGGKGKYPYGKSF